MSTQQTDRVRESSSFTINQRIDDGIRRTLKRYQSKPKNAINEKIEDLNREWDIERNIGVVAPSLILGGLALSFVNKKWLLLPGVVATFLLQHGLQGWCPPVSILRAMKFRTKGEIDREKFALKAIRGDFDRISHDKDPESVLASFI